MTGIKILLITPLCIVLAINYLIFGLFYRLTKELKTWTKNPENARFI